MRPDIKDRDYMYRLVISQLFYDGHQELALSLASSIGCLANPPAPCDQLLRLISMAKQFNEAEQQYKENGLQFDANSAGLDVEFGHQELALSVASSIGWPVNPPAPCDKLFRLISIAKLPESPEPCMSETTYLTAYKASCRPAAFNCGNTRMSVATIADLPLELVEEIARHLDVKDVPKLMMVNKRLYSSYAMDPSIVLGEHVTDVLVQGERGGIGYSNWVKKFRSIDSPLLLNAFVLPFVKRVNSCDRLDISFDGERSNCFYAEWADRMFLGQLKSVNELEFHVDTKKECLKFLTSFCGSVKKKATLSMYRFEQDKEVKKQLGKFIENQLNGCEKVSLFTGSDLKDCFHVYLEAMMKTQIKFIQIRGCPQGFYQMVTWVVNHGIPSKNSEAVIYLSTYSFSVDTFLSQMPGLQQVDDSLNHSATVSRANALLRKSREAEEGFHGWTDVFDEKSLCFRHQIDPTTDCIYMCSLVFLNLTQFLAFYLPSQ